MEIVEVGIVFRRWRRWKGITVVRVGIFCTFLKIPVFLLLHPRAVVVVVIVAGIDVVRTAIIVVVVAVAMHIAHAYIANSPANNIVLTIAPTSVMVVVMVTHIMSTATSSTDIIR